jgi:hypothetical protein
MSFQLTIKHNGAEISFTAQDLAAITPVIEPVVKVVSAPVKKTALKNRVSKSGKRLGRPPKQPVA